ncbi:3-methyladenine DNA glycosylase [Nonlabens spongiae]|uniref:Putative 3-methyladenine DNA glycosylase n=1 Tax=Nonlabens spongiae TaxID=331648 RepID=A0A1W6MHR2_9FLAO|nr:DNA-3-methyladenine glycosylase [Nonlabens spongiae]ARN77110.1 3-methyladenine DNA glycosylase [Nonlabens spongiae]
MKLPASYYQQNDVVHIAKDLIGKVIVSMVDDKRTAGIITETEAYRGVGDKACHAHLGRFTDRTKIMYENGGVAYVYLCYGIHNLFNIITNTDQQADAVLIRAAEPTEGIEHMLHRRGKEKLDKTLTSGPGNFSKAFGLDRSHYGEDLTGDLVWIEDAEVFAQEVAERSQSYLDDSSKQITSAHFDFDQRPPLNDIGSDKIISKEDIITSKRIGIDYAEEDADLPWRFYLWSSQFVSKR